MPKILGKKKKYFLISIISIVVVTLFIILDILLGPFNIIIPLAKGGDVSLTCRPVNDTEEYNLSEPIYVSFELTNIKKGPVKIIMASFDIECCYLETFITSPDNVTYFYYGGRYLPTALKRVLWPNETLKLIYNLKELPMIREGSLEGKEEYLTWNLTGKYTIQFEYYLEGDGSVFSNSLNFYINEQ